MGELKVLANEPLNSRNIDVWDFGGIQTSGELYNNHITPEMLDSQTTIKSGTFATTVYGDLTVANPVSSDRSYYYGPDGTTPGVNSSGSSGTQTFSYDDGYTANGMYYANGTGGTGRRFLTLDHVVAGDKITVYGGTHNASSETIHLVHAAVSVDGTNVTVTPDPSEAQDHTAAFGGIGQKVELVAQYSGSYQIYVSAGAGGKPYFQRVVRTPGVKVSGSVNLNGSDIDAGYLVSFTNQTTGDATTVHVNADNTFDAVLATGYDYIATLKDVTSYRFSDETKLISTSTSDIASGKSVSLDVIANQLVTVSGNIKGFDSSYDVRGLEITFTPPEGSLASPIAATINTDAMTFSADVQDGIEYTAVMSGVNDYEITDGGSIHVSVDTVQDITVDAKAVYTAAGLYQGFPSTAQVSSITFTNVDDGYIYKGTVTNGGYSVSLRNGAYSVTAVTSENYSTSSHVVINGQNTNKDILFVNNTAPEPLPWVPDLYVGDSSKQNNYNTVKEALAAAARMNPTGEAKRITIHIAPGVYREQLVIKTPFITLVNSHPNPTSDPSTQAKITWYYGIGYKYYSIGADGFYNEEKAFDKYSKNIASKWGGTVYLTSTATDFKAQNIVFENSFNKYITEEELADGVELANAEAGTTISVDRKIFTDVTSKTATERAAAMLIEGNRAEFVGCSFLGSQDTLFTGGSGTNSSYFKDSFIEGNTDYIFGDGNVVFDNVTLNFAGYSDKAVGGYITAARDSAAYGYLFRNATVTAGSKNLQTSGFFGRPWGAGAKVTFVNTKLQNGSMIDPRGWTDMSGPAENANFAEYNTTYNGGAVDTAQRRAPVLTDTQAAAIDVTDYFGGWTPTFYAADTETPPTFKTAPFFTTDDDINIPYTGNTISLGYEFEHTNDNLNDSSLIQWYRVSPDGTETLIQATKAYISKTYKITSGDIGFYIKAVVTPETVKGLKGTPNSIQLDNLVRKGSSGGGGNEIPDGQRVNIYVAGDSTVKTYGPSSDTGGWGEYLQSFFNSEKVNVVNYANGGRSSRSFINEGSLDKIASTIKAGDYLLVQFAHNDSANQQGYLLDRFVSVGEPDANGIYPSIPGVKEATPLTLPAQYGAEYYTYTSGTFKWYLQQYIDVARNAGATPILVTPVSRQYFNSDGTIRTHHDATDTATGTITSVNNAYVRAVEQLGEEQGVKVVDMFSLTRDAFEKAYKNDPAASNGSSPLAKAVMVAGDSTHNNKIGGFYNGGLLAKEIQGLGYNISNYVIPPIRVGGLDSKNSVQFVVDSHSNVSVYTPDESGVYTTQPDTYWTDETQALIDQLSPGSEQPIITSIVKPADRTVMQGNTAVLPQTVTAVYSDGAQKAVGVIWDTVDTSKVGTIEVHGTVDGFAAGVTIKVTITAKTNPTSTIWIVGDSTVSSFSDHYYYPRYGWGTQIGNYLDGSFHIQNIALSGRSSKSYTLDPEYQTLRNGMKSGDYLIIGFGHNDEKAEAERYTNPNGTYLDSGSFANSLYENYIKPAQAAGTKVILSTPIVRRTDSGVWSNSNLHITGTSGAFEGGDYAQAIRDLGTALQVPVVDMTTLTKALYDELGPAETLYLHAWTSSKPVSVDNTHTNIWGGKYNAFLVTKTIKELGVSGLSEHVIDAAAPTKADTLVSNPDYQDAPYTGELPQSSLWPDHGIWKGTVFGDVGGTPSSENQTLETDGDGNMHISVANNKGKIAGSSDGIAMYYYKVPANSTFTLTAKAKLNRFELNDQVSFGLMVRDAMFIDSYTKDAVGDYVAAAPLKLTKAAAGGFWNSFARKSGVLTQGGTAVNPIAAGDTVELRIEGTADGYMAKFGNEAAVTGGFDFKLTSIDPDYVYVGMFAARNADVTFSDIKLLVDGVEVTGDDVVETPSDVADPNSTKDRALRKYALEGYAAAQEVTGGGLLLETSERYFKVSTAEEFLKAIDAAKTSGKPSVIELTDDIALGSLEIGTAITTYSSIIKPASHQPLLHPKLIQTGVSTLKLSGMNNLTLFSKHGAKLLHTTIDISNSSNIMIRNLVFDELWEWDEATQGDYDVNDWDYITIQGGSTGIWIDHATFYKAYDGIVDVKKAVSTRTSDVTISWSKFLPASEGSFFDEMMGLLEANPENYPYYHELLTTHGMSKEQIRQYSAGQKKAHLIGGSDTEANTSNLRITLANNYYKDTMDRMPRLRKGYGHVYNTIMDAAVMYDLRNSLADDYAASKVVSNGAISTQGASVLVENSYISGITKALLSGNGSSPAGYIGAINSVYVMNGAETELTVTNSSNAGLVLDAGAFKNALPYSYQLYDAQSLATSVLPYTGAGAVYMSSVQWEKAVYNDLADEEAPAWISGSLNASDVTSTGLTLTWSGATDNVGVTGYKVYQGATDLGTVTGSTYHVSGLTAGASYTFKVEAVDAAGNWSTSGPSLTVIAGETPVVTDTAAPVWTNGRLTASSVGETGLTLSWNAASDNIGVTGYKVYRGTTLLTTVTGSVYTYPVTGLGSGTRYTFTVQAGDAAGNWSTNGPTVTVTTDDDSDDDSSGSSNSPAAPSTPAAPAVPATPATPAAPTSPETPVLVVTTTPGQPAFDFSKPESVSLLKEVLAEKIKSSSNQPVSFEDVSDHWSAESIQVFSRLGVVHGYEDRTFKPDANITRGEFAAIVAKTFNIGIGGVEAAPFQDINENWAKDAIMALASNGIINGYEDGTFRAEANISRAEMIAIISRIINLNTVQGANSATFNDIGETWNKEQIKAAAEAGIINGKGEGSFEPDQNSTRAEALTVLLRSIKLSPEIAAFMDSLK
ncbi:pectinesterase family protein [Paenibacillus turpanensis]|uniref:pectinesterase family protein n=1 Tax=Paenibacillus turpanensis TaxID=2689078 RepID=UPI001FB5B52A|nr:pectinesterase family protein [Paenibacillus turpanensis]